MAGGVTAFLSVLLAGQGRLETNMSGGGGPSGALAGSGVWGRCRRLLWPDAGPGSAWWTPSRHPDKPATFSRRVFSQDGCFLCVLTFVLLSPLCSRGGRPPVSVRLAPPHSGGLHSSRTGGAWGLALRLELPRALSPMVLRGRGRSGLSGTDRTAPGQPCTRRAASDVASRPRVGGGEERRGAAGNRGQVSRQQEDSFLLGAAWGRCGGFTRGYPAPQHSRTWRDAPPRETAGDASQLRSAAVPGLATMWGPRSPKSLHVEPPVALWCWRAFPTSWLPCPPPAWLLARAFSCPAPCALPRSDLCTP